MPTRAPSTQLPPQTVVAAADAPPVPPSPTVHPAPLRHSVAPATLSNELPSSLFHVLEEVVAAAQRSSEAQHHTGDEGAPSAASQMVSETVSASAPKETLDALPDSIAASLDRHEIPVSVGGSASETVEMPPRVLWETRGSATPTVDGVRVVSAGSVVGGKRQITVVLSQPLPTLLGTIKAIVAALDDAERLAGESGAAKSVLIVLSNVDSPNFFLSAQSPLELEKTEYIEYCHARDHLLLRICSSSTCEFRAAFAGGIVDLGADLFFACYSRTVADRTSVGYPSLCLGNPPSPHTIRFLRSRCGAERVVKLLPGLHHYEATSLQSVGVAVNDHAEEGTFIGRCVLAGENMLFHDWVPLRTRQLLLLRLFTSKSFSQELSAAVVAEEVSDGEHSVETEKAGIWRWQRHAFAVMLSTGATVEDVPAWTPSPATVSLMRYCNAMPSRELPPLASSRVMAFPHRDKASWAPKRELLENTSSSADVVGCTVIFDCSPHAIRETVDFLHSSKDLVECIRHKACNVVLLGSCERAAELTDLFPAPVVVSPVSLFEGIAGHLSLQSVVAFAKPDCPPDLCQDAVSAAVAYLSSKRVPYVLSSSRAAKRLMGALFAEAFLLSRVVPARLIEEAATRHLGMSLGPFRMMDAVGARQVQDMVSVVEQTPRWQFPLMPQVGRMCSEGFLGAGSGIRGGFYSYDEEGHPTGPVRQNVVDTFFKCGRMTSSSVALCLLSAVITTGCDLLEEGDLLSQRDLNLLTVAVLGFSATKGGALQVANSLPGGPATLVDFMEETYVLRGVHPTPHAQLKNVVVSTGRFEV